MMDTYILISLKLQMYTLIIQAWFIIKKKAKEFTNMKLVQPVNKLLPFVI